MVFLTVLLPCVYAGVRVRNDTVPTSASKYEPFFTSVFKLRSNVYLTSVVVTGYAFPGDFSI